MANAKHHFAPLSADEVKAIKLMNILRKSKASLEAFDTIMDWHFKSASILCDQEKLSDSGAYVSQKSLFKHLRKIGRAHV